MGIFMVYAIPYNMYLFLDNIKFWFELVNQKPFEMK
jgi:hypothetical protein